MYIFILTLIVLVHILIFKFVAVFELQRYFIHWPKYNTQLMQNKKLPTASNCMTLWMQFRQSVLFHQSVLLFLTVGDDKGGQMVLHGEPATVAQLGPQ
jgi:hypothetical protein